MFLFRMRCLSPMTELVSAIRCGQNAFERIRTDHSLGCQPVAQRLAASHALRKLTCKREERATRGLCAGIRSSRFRAEIVRYFHDVLDRIILGRETQTASELEHRVILRQHDARKLMESVPDSKSRERAKQDRGNTTALPRIRDSNSQLRTPRTIRRRIAGDAHESLVTTAANSRDQRHSAIIVGRP